MMAVAGAALAGSVLLPSMLLSRVLLPFLNSPRTMILNIPRSRSRARVARAAASSPNPSPGTISPPVSSSTGPSAGSPINREKSRRMRTTVSPRALAASYPTAVPAFWQRSSQDQKQADDAWVQQISQQQQLLTQNAAALQRAQGNLNGSGGEMQAIQSTGQILAAMAQELQQIHALLLAQQTALANQMQTNASQSALSQAAGQKALTWTFTPSSGIGW